MYELTVKAHFSSAHNLRDYQGKCENLHGHNWHVEVFVEAERLDATGMVMDFKKLKDETNRVMDKLDHKYLNEIPPFDTVNTTAENLASFIFKELMREINDGNVRVSKVRVWESEKAAAAYSE